MLVIRLTRVGKKNSPAYRIVVAEKSRAVKRKFIEILGHYNPTRKPKELAISKERALFWMSQGAQPSDTVRNLMCDQEILPKTEKAKKVYAKAKPIDETKTTATPVATVTEEEKPAEAVKEESEAEVIVEEAAKE